MHRYLDRSGLFGVGLCCAGLNGNPDPNGNAVASQPDDCHGHKHLDCNSHTDAHTHRHSYAYSHCDSDKHADLDADTDLDTDTNLDANPVAYADAGPAFTAYLYTDAGRAAYTDTGTRTAGTDRVGDAGRQRYARSQPDFRCDQAARHSHFEFCLT